MRALRLEADWEPRPESVATLDEADVTARVARRGNQVWRNPRIAVAAMPDPSPGPDEVVIRVRACGICGSDFHFVESDADGYMLYPGMVRTPVVTGHEFAGVVEAVGPDVRDFAAGDLVCAEEIAWCGDCLACRAGRPNNCTRIEELGFSFDGAQAEYVVTRARYCWSLRSSRATPMMRPPWASEPWRQAWNRAGISLRQARSPVPPKRTRSKLMFGRGCFGLM